MTECDSKFIYRLVSPPAETFVATFSVGETPTARKNSIEMASFSNYTKFVEAQENLQCKPD